MKHLFFEKQDIVCYQPGLEGNKIYSSYMAIGDRAGDTCHMGNLWHEVAHFVEICDLRCTRFGWGLKESDFPLTCEALEREARVWGIQAVLCEAAGIPFGVREHAALLDFFSSSLNLPTFEKGEEAMIKTMEDWIIAERDKWTLPMILQEWERKCKIAERDLKDVANN